MLLAKRLNSSESLNGLAMALYIVLGNRMRSPSPNQEKALEILASLSMEWLLNNSLVLSRIFSDRRLASIFVRPSGDFFSPIDTLILFDRELSFLSNRILSSF